MTYVNMYQKLGLSFDQVKIGLEQLLKPRTIRRRGKTETLLPSLVLEGVRYFPADLHKAEHDIARHIRRLQAAQLEALTADVALFGGLTPDDSQVAALRAAATSNVVVMTGGPGVGKTTVAKAMISMYETQAYQIEDQWNAALTYSSVRCCAPTGKAAIRMRQQTGRDALTAHQLIGLVPGGRPKHDDGPAEYYADGSWRRGGPIEATAVVLDETSMVDVRLLASLLAAIPTGSRLLIVGDVDQLPSIGAGRTLFDLIVSQAVPVVRLIKIHRQASESRIPYVARDVNHGNCPDLQAQGTDVTHWETLDAAVAADQIVRAVCEAIPQHKHFSVDEIQVLSPQKKGPCGVVALNNALQARLNPPVNDSHEFDVFAGSADEGRYSIRTGDRVIQTRNNYELGPVMNGEMGTVVAADPNGLNVQAFMDARWTGKETPVEGAEAEGDDAELDGEETLPGGVVRAHDDDGEAVLRWKTPRVVVVNYGDRMIAYTKDEARELHLGYAITVHKSQGSQFKAIVIALHCENVRMLSRPLLYTAITRAEKYVLMVGTTDQVTTAAQNTRGVERRTTLQDRLVKAPRNM